MPLPPSRIKAESEAVARAIKAVDIDKIGKLRPECMALVANRQKTGFLVDVREPHNKRCGGAPMTAPRVFSIDVAWNGKLRGDAGDYANSLALNRPKP